MEIKCRRSDFWGNKHPVYGHYRIWSVQLAICPWKPFNSLDQTQLHCTNTENGLQIFWVWQSYREDNQIRSKTKKPNCTDLSNTTNSVPLPDRTFLLQGNETEKPSKRSIRDLSKYTFQPDPGFSDMFLHLDKDTAYHDLYKQNRKKREVTLMNLSSVAYREIDNSNPEGSTIAPDTDCNKPVETMDVSIILFLISIITSRIGEYKFLLIHT